MCDVQKTRLFSLLTESSLDVVSNNEMENAYDEFTKQLRNLNQSDSDYLVTIRTLNFIRIEFVAQESLYLYDQEKKCAKILRKESYIVYRVGDSGTLSPTQVSQYQ